MGDPRRGSALGIIVASGRGLATACSFGILSTACSFGILSRLLPFQQIENVCWFHRLKLKHEIKKIYGRCFREAREDRQRSSDGTRWALLEVREVVVIIITGDG